MCRRTFARSVQSRLGLQAFLPAAARVARQRQNKHNFLAAFRLPWLLTDLPDPTAKKYLLRGNGLFGRTLDSNGTADEIPIHCFASRTGAFFSRRYSIGIFNVGTSLSRTSRSRIE